MDLREAKALELAARFQIAWEGSTCRVPSQSGNGQYTVERKTNGFTCTCEDFQFRQKPCKHILASQFVWERIGGKPAPAVDTDTLPVRKTYKQNWPAYNEAQTTEKHRLQVLLHDLCRGLQEPVRPSNKKGRKPVPIADMVFACAFKIYSTFSSRRFACDLKDAHEKGYLSRPLHYNKINTFLEDPELTPILHALIVRASLPLKDDGTEWWSAREMLGLLGYERWENLENVIERAKATCRNTGHQAHENFRDTTKVSGRRGPGSRDVHLTRFGAYLVAMNGDPNKPEIAAAQAYFAIQTRRAELELPSPPVIQPAQQAVRIRPWGERLSITIQRHRLHVVQNFPAGSFTTYTATTAEILMIEDELLRHQMPLKFGDLPDGSIGKRWANYREQQGWPEPIGTAPLEMPHLDRVVEVLTYSCDLRPWFERWLNLVYIPECMPDYFHNKNEWKEFQLPAASAAEQASLRLTGTHAKLSHSLRRQLTAVGGIVQVGYRPPEKPKQGELF